MHRSSVCWSGASRVAKDPDIAGDSDHKRTLYHKTYGIKIGCSENYTVFEHTDLVIGKMQSYFMT